MKKLFFLFLLGFSVMTARAQDTELFFGFKSGTPFASSIGEETWFWNYSFGVERYYADKISISLCYRKMFNLVGEAPIFNRSAYDPSENFSYSYTEEISSYAIDFESKFFFDEVDEGWYMSSGIAYQPIFTDITVDNVERIYGSNPNAVPVLQAGAHKDEVTPIFPITVNVGHRNSSDTFVFDYFFGLTYNMGSANVAYQYSFFEYPEYSRLTFLFGLKAGIKI